MKDPATLNWFKEQIKAFDEVKDHYGDYALFLEDALNHMIKGRLCPEATVQVRPKKRASFAGKVLRKKDKYRNPASQLTDLCGGRIIVHTKSEVVRIVEFIREHFEIDDPNSLDQVDRLQAGEFGYRSVHLIVWLSEAKLAGMPLTEDIRKKARKNPKVLELKLKAEIQVRTIAQHIWADIGHDRVYKSEFEVPFLWKRELGKIAALLEDVDDSFTRIIEGLSIYQANYGLYRDPDKMEEELAILDAMLEFDPEDPVLTGKAARQALSLQEWKYVSDLVNKFPADKKTTDLRVLHGLAKCRQNEDGLAILQEAVRLDPGNVEALATLAEELPETKKNKAELYRLYGRALELDPTNPRVLGGYLRFKIGDQFDWTFIPLIRTTLEAAIDKCRAHVKVNIDVPWAYRQIGEFNLLLAQSDARLHPEPEALRKREERNYSSLSAFAKAISLHATKPEMLDRWLQGIEPLAAENASSEGLKWVRQLLLLGKAVKSPDPREAILSGGLRQSDLQEVEGPVVIVAGGCDAAYKDEMAGYGTLLSGAFANRPCTLFSGGTEAGISGLVGQLAAQSGGGIRAIGYLPDLPAILEDKRYTRTCRMTNERDFSPMQPLQNWIDLIARGTDPADVKLVGINGGRIAGFEYRLALALGAQVGLIVDSGREAGGLQADLDWRDEFGLVLLPRTTEAVRQFLDQPREIQPLARLLHQEYLLQHKPRDVSQQAALAEWRDLSERYRELNRGAAEWMLTAHLEELKLEQYPVKDREIVVYTIHPDDVNRLARIEHERWRQAKLAQGWTSGDKQNEDQKAHPDLKDWGDLPEWVREKNRKMIRQIPRLLKEVGLELRPAQINPSQGVH